MPCSHLIGRLNLHLTLVTDIVSTSLLVTEMGHTYPHIAEGAYISTTFAH